MDTDTINAIQASEATNAVANALGNALASKSAACLAPQHFALHDLEKYLPNRRRASGVMTTASVDDFAAYTSDHAEVGATVFIDSDKMRATAVLNLGTSDAPGHADKTAVLALQATAAYSALKLITNGPKKQADAAEFIEDWQDCIKCLDDVGDDIKISHAIEALRTITIEAMRKLETRVGDFEESQGTLDSVKATATQKLPSKIVFKANPFKDLPERRFELRVGVQTLDKPLVVFRIIKAEDHQQQMADELVTLLREKITADKAPVCIGTYQKA